MYIIDGQDINAVEQGGNNTQEQSMPQHMPISTPAGPSSSEQQLKPTSTNSSRRTPILIAGVVIIVILALVAYFVIPQAPNGSLTPTTSTITQTPSGNNSYLLPNITVNATDPQDSYATAREWLLFIDTSPGDYYPSLWHYQNSNNASIYESGLPSGGGFVEQYTGNTSGTHTVYLLIQQSSGNEYGNYTATLSLNDGPKEGTPIHVSGINAQTALKLTVNNWNIQNYSLVQLPTSSQIPLGPKTVNITANSTYYGFNTIRINGTISPAPQNHYPLYPHGFSSYLITPNGVAKFYNLYTIIANNGAFNVMWHPSTLPAPNNWINGTYTLVAIYNSSYGSTTFNWNSSNPQS
ncbi:MAG: hypothetical protein ACREBF_00955 [Candidatus Micrarchaeales archaeon]